MRFFYKNLFFIFFSLVLSAGILQARDENDLKARRSYDGAPPIIPHEIPEMLGPLTCLSCHKSGGYSPLLGKAIPKTPHAEYTNCVQCHVSQKTEETFLGLKNFFERWANVPAIPEKTLISAPPVIPHGPQYRSRCASCHTGEGAVSALKSPHPTRLNCVQCHVWQNQKEMLQVR